MTPPAAIGDGNPSPFFDVSFEHDALPSDWTELSSEPVFEGGLLHVYEDLRFKFALPGLGWNRFRVEIETAPIAPGRISLSDDGRSLVTDFLHGVHFLGTYRNVPVTTAVQAVEKSVGRRTVVFEIGDGRGRILIDGREVLQGSDPMPGPALGFWTLGFHGNWLIYRVAASGAGGRTEPWRVYPARRSKSLHLEVAVDFNNDARRAAWTEDMMHRYFAEFESWGVTRCHWVWNGDGADWPGPDGHPHARRTIETLGRVFPVAVAAAHAHGVAIHGVFSPFEAREYERLVRSFGREKADEFVMARKPSAHGPAEEEVCARIDLVKEDARAAAFEAKDVVLLVSDDNRSYAPYEGPVLREEVVEEYPVWEHTAGGGRPTGARRTARVLRFDGLAIRNRYVALRVDSEAESFANSLVNLIHVFGPGGELRNLTLGLPVPRRRSPRRASDPVSDARSSAGTRKDLRAGIAFGESMFRPSANFPGLNSMALRHVLDAREAFIAFARGKERGLTSLSPSFQESRDAWLAQLRIMLDAGADGIELRVRHHHSPLTWAEYGFERPVRDRFLDRYGVDLWTTDDFDPMAWRRLRGEAYTEFCRQAKRLAGLFGKPMGVHIGPVQECHALDIHWDWRGWIDEGIADSVTMKELWPNTRLAEDVLSHARPRGIPVVFSPYANSIWGRPNPEALCAHRIRLAGAYGYDGFQFYESAAVTLATEDGRIVMTRPKLREVFREIFVTRG